MEERGGCDIAGREKVGIRASCKLPQVRRYHQDMVEVNGVDDKDEVVGED